MPPEALVLVSCVSRKNAGPAPARELYCSEWFCRARSFVESHGAEWLILSAKYGVVAPGAVIERYEQTLNDAAISERRAWVRMVVGQMETHIESRRYIVILAGHRYRQFLVPELQARGLKIEVTMANLAIGKQLAWLAANRRTPD